MHLHDLSDSLAGAVGREGVKVQTPSVDQKPILCLLDLYVCMHCVVTYPPSTSQTSTSGANQGHQAAWSGKAGALDMK